MSWLCLVLFINTSGQKNILNIKDIAAIEERDNGSASHYTKIWMVTSGLSLDTKISLKEVLEKLEKAKEECK